MADLDQLDFCLLAELAGGRLYFLHSKHLQVYLADRCIGVIDHQKAVEVVCELTDFRSNFTLHLKFGDLIDISHDLLVRDHEVLDLWEDVWAFDGLPTGLGHLNEKGNLIG